MLTIFFIAGLITVVLAMVAVVSFISGIVLWCFARTRFIAPFVTLIPTLAALGAVGGSYGLGYVLFRMAGEASVLPFWGWVVGYPAGGYLGGVIGLSLALLFRRWTSRPVPNTAVDELSSAAKPGR